MTPRTPNTRPTDAELVQLLRLTHTPLTDSRLSCKGCGVAWPCPGAQAADALEAASAEPRTYGDGEARYATPEAAATDSVSVWDTFDEYDYKGATRRDVIRAVLRSVGMETQEPHLVTTDDEAASLHRPDCSPDCSTHHRMTNEAPYDDDSYTVSGVDYFFTEGR